MSTTVFRVEKNREFVVLNNRFLRNKEMSLKAKGLLALCLALPEDWQYSLNGLCAICKESQTAIRSTLKELEKFKHLRRERKKDEKGQFVYLYILYEVPYTENEHADNLTAEKQSTGNDIQQKIKKKDINKKSIKKENIYNINNYISILDTIPDNDLRNLYASFLDNRNRLGDPLTVKGFELLIERVRELAGLDVEKQKSLLKTALINNWKNVYIKDEPGSSAVDELRSFYE